jgi:Uma2 family endonuclease
MGTASKYRLWNFDDFCALIPEGQKADLIEGVIYVASPDNIEHHGIYGWLYRLLSDFLDATSLGGHVFGSRITFRLDGENSPEPDLAYLSPERSDLIQTNRIDGAPDWAVEIISPDSVDRDYEKKLAQYERFGVSEYWIIDPLEQTMTCYRLGRDGKYKEVRPRKGIIASKVIPGFWVRPTWFWQTPLPNKNETLQEILAASANGK